MGGVIICRADTETEASAIARRLQPSASAYYHGRVEIVAAEARPDGWVQVGTDRPWVYRSWSLSMTCLARAASRHAAEMVLTSPEWVHQYQVGAIPA